MSTPRAPTRAERLRGSLPQIYSTGAGTGLGALLDMLGHSLEQLDGDQVEVLRNRWPGRAGAEELDEQVPSPLELLGRQIGLSRHSWDGGTKSESESEYRWRLLESARIMREPLGTPKTILGMVAVALGCELCPRLTRTGDTTTGWGLIPGARAKCSGCRRGACDAVGARRVELQLIDAAPVRRSVRLTGVRSGNEFKVPNHSLFADRPEVRITAEEPGGVTYPCLTNPRTRQTFIYAAHLEAGQTLHVEPKVPDDDTAKFDTPGGQIHHTWRDASPEGRAELSSDHPSDPTEHIYLVGGYDFGGPLTRFGSASFAAYEQVCTTPTIGTRDAQWKFHCATVEDLSAWGLLDLVVPVKDPTEGPCTVELNWWARPPSSFRLRVPMTAWIRARQERGLGLLYEAVQRHRAPGVLATVELPEQSYHDEHQVEHLGVRANAHLRVPEEVGLDEGGPSFEVDARLQDEHEVGERVAFDGVFGATPFGGSRFGTKGE